ncbi:MAG: hypothetical protein RI947_607 [Candidatus Parcubacteria bacterium]|jgi:hypothetical protein
MTDQRRKTLAEIMSAPLTAATDAVSLLAEPLASAGVALFAIDPARLVDHYFLPGETARLMLQQGVYVNVQLITSPDIVVVTYRRIREAAPEYASWGADTDEHSADKVLPLAHAGLVLLNGDINVLQTTFLQEDIERQLGERGVYADVSIISSAEVVVITYRRVEAPQTVSDLT